MIVKLAEEKNNEIHQNFEHRGRYYQMYSLQEQNTQVIKK